MFSTDTIRNQNLEANTMEKMIRVLCACLAIVMLLSLTACGGKQTAPAETSAPAATEEPAASETAEPAAAEKVEAPAAESEKKAPVVLKLGAQCNPGSDEDRCLTKFAELVNTRSEGSLEVQYFGASQLGSLSDLMEGVSIGTIEMCEIGVAVYMAIVPSFEIYDTWMFDGPEDFSKLFSSEYSQKVLQQLVDEAGIRVLAYNAAGGGRFDTWTKNPVATIAELKGLNIRIPAVPTMATIYNGIGANAVNMSFADTYTGAQTGVIDGCCLDAANMINGNLTEQFKYQLVGVPNFQPMGLTVNEKVWQSLSAEQQEIIIAAAKEAIQDYGDELYYARQAILAEQLAEQGITTVSMNEEDLATMQAVADKTLWDALSPFFEENELTAIFEICGK